MIARFRSKNCHSFFILLVLLFLCLAHIVALAQPTNTSPVYAVAWSPDGSLIAFAQNEESCTDSFQYISVVDAITGEMIQRLWAGHCSVFGLDWGLDGMRLAAATADSEGFWVWDVSSGEILATGQLPGQGLISIRWHPTADELLLTSPDNSIGIFDPLTGQFLRSLNVAGTIADWNPDGSEIVSVSTYQSGVYVADSTSGQPRMRLYGDTDIGIGTGVDWSPDGNRIVSASFDNRLRIWDAETGESLAIFDTGEVGCVQWSPDSEWLAIASRIADREYKIQILDATTGQVIETFTHSGNVYSLDWSPDGTQLVYAGSVQPGDAPITIVSIDLPEATAPASLPG